VSGAHKMEKKILLIVPPTKAFYKNAKIRTAAHFSPFLAPAVLGAVLLEQGFAVRVFDFNIYESGDELFLKELGCFNPDYAGVTFTTPLFGEMNRICQMIKWYDKKICIIGGGAHCSSFPEDTLKHSDLDVVIIGEGDWTLARIIAGEDKEGIDGIAWRKGDEILLNLKDGFIKDLDNLPFPAWQLYDIKKYATTRVLSRKSPAGWIETSRGCVFACTYCNKSVFGQTFRVKCPRRVVDEMEYMLRAGFREIHIADDGFTTDIKRAKAICDEIIYRRLKFPWAPVAGLRVDRVDDELLNKMRRAGCYRIYFGIESGNQKVIDRIKKGITLDEVRKAVKLCKKNKLEVYGFFMLGLPGDTEKTIQDTIDFAKELGLDMAKASIATPLPATDWFNELESLGLIKSNDWTKLNLYVPSREIFDHPTLKWETIEKYMDKFYRDFYFRPVFIIKRFFKSLISGNLLSDIRDFFRTKW